MALYTGKNLGRFVAGLEQASGEAWSALLLSNDGNRGWVACVETNSCLNVRAGGGSRGNVSDSDSGVVSSPETVTNRGRFGFRRFLRYSSASPKAERPDQAISATCCQVRTGGAGRLTMPSPDL